MANDRETQYLILGEHGNLDFDQIRDQIVSSLRGGRSWVDIWARKVCDDHAIIDDWTQSEHRLFRVGYTVENDEVVLGTVQEVEEETTYSPKAPILASERINGLILLDEDAGEDSSDIELLRMGSWDHPQYGKIEVDEADFDLFISSFENKIRGVDLAVDQAHEPDKGAAGWFQKLFKKETDHGTALFATVNWTPLGKELITNKIFRYISPEFTFEYKDDESGEKTKNVLFGAALTNRPFIKGMSPVLMSEDVIAGLSEMERVSLDKRFCFKEGSEGTMGNIDLKEIRKCLRLAETADEKSVMEALSTLIAGAEGSRVLLKELCGAIGLNEGSTPEAVRATIQSLVDKAKATSDKETEVVALKEENRQLSTRVAALELTGRKAEWEQLRTKAMSEGRMTAAQAPKFEERFMKDPQGTRELVELLEPIIDLKEHGSSRDPASSNSAKVFDQKINAVMKDNPGLSYSEAMIKVAEEEPALWAEVDRERRGA